MSDLEKIQALFDTGEEGNIKIGLELCGVLPESEALLECYRGFYAQYPDIFNDQAAELWAKIQKIAQIEEVALLNRDWMRYVQLLVRVKFLKILIQTEEASIQIPAEIERCQQLTGLYLISDTNGQYFGFNVPANIELCATEAIGKLNNLRVLELSELRLAQSPKGMKAFGSVRYLLVSNCVLETPCDWLNELPELEYAELTLQTQLALPAHLSGWARLQSVQMNSHLISSFCALPSLTKLTVHGAQEGDRFDDLGKRYPNLQQLLIHQITSLDLRESLPTLSQLQTLALTCSSDSRASPLGLVRLPRDISALQQLEEIRFDRLELPDGVGMFGQAKQLKTIQIEECQLETLPDSWASLPQVKDLRLVGCGLRVLPDWLGDWTALYWLKISQNRLETLPDWVWERLNHPSNSISIDAWSNLFNEEIIARLKQY